MLLISIKLHNEIMKVIFLHHNTNISGLAVRKKLKLDSYSLPKHELVVEECLKSVCTQMLLRRSVALIQCDEDMQGRRERVINWRCTTDKRVTVPIFFL